jgi:hypothetical protein
MVRAAVMIGRVSMAWQDNLRPQPGRAGNGGVEIVNLKPKQSAISVCKFGIADATMMMVSLPAVQLKNEPVARNQPLILSSSVITSEGQQPLIPAAAGLDIVYANKRLGTHWKFVG